MCGLAGFVAPPSEVMGRVVEAMSARLIHRGPDDFGSWVDPGNGVALGHRRLSIVDLSPHGHQPMHSACGRYVIAFNGEVYNHQELRKELERKTEAPSWRGHSDTEVALAAITAWGLEAAIRRFVGMFAFALWDKQERVLFLARDRLGEKPLYYGTVRDAFVFASELKAIKAYPDHGLSVNRDAVAALLRFGVVPAPCSIYEGINKLRPGCILAVRVSAPGKCLISEPQEYWSALALSCLAGSQGETLSVAEAVDRLQELLGRAVRDQMVADVPLGAFLSGGIDSSMIVALMQAQSSRPVRTFTIGFHEDAFNEAHYAREVARHLGTDHTELYVTDGEAAAVIPKLPEIYDEPFADASQIPTYLVSHLTRQHVTVSLSGDGGDELFGGYPRYQFGEMLWKRMSWIPRQIRKFASIPIRKLPARNWDALLTRILPERLKPVVTGHRLHRLAGVMAAGSFDELYGLLISHWQDYDKAVLGRGRDTQCSGIIELPSAEDNCLNHMRSVDLMRYLPDDLLVKVDRASMSNSLESRAPFLDHRVVEFAFGLPSNLLIRDGQGKWLLRQLLYRFVPQQLIDRPKAGFGVPLAEWLRGSLRDWAESLISESRLRAEGLFDAGTIRRIWDEHLKGRHDRNYMLWDILMFQAWSSAQENR